MQSNHDLVTQNNYRDVRAYLDDQVKHFLINRENWVLKRFRKIPPSPSPEGIEDLNRWITTYLPKGSIRDLNTRFGAST
jgi:hypothetical protein